MAKGGRPPKSPLQLASSGFFSAAGALEAEDESDGAEDDGIGAGGTGERGAFALEQPMAMQARQVTDPRFVIALMKGEKQIIGFVVPIVQGLWLFFNGVAYE